MSEALSSSEIEDVLSSIRRLVSDDLRPGAKAAAAEAGEKLILTPALRVVQNQTSDAPAIEEVVATVSAGVDGQADEWESETGDDQPLAAQTSQDWMLPEVVDVTEIPSSDQADDTDHLRTEEASGFDDDSAFVAAYPEEIAEEVIAEKARDEPLPGWAQEDEADEEDLATTESWAAASIEPDAAWADEAEAEIVQELAGALPPQMDEDEIILNAQERMVPVDEEMLREIVRDVLREELQGPLGERITRNIRKLVRAEIARVVATEGLA